ncbi:cyclin domain-containing protein [Choanephora cucurbitarum]|nr:cyclin domain-containing protein [Choanephora cucurbitarum]
MIVVSTLNTDADFHSGLSHNLSLRVRHGTDHLILYTAYNVKSLLECSRERTSYQQRLLPTLSVFVRHLFHHCQLTPTLLVVTLIYLQRLKEGLPLHSKGEFDTPYKIFIAAVVLATKFIEDKSTITQSIYRFISPLYKARDINEMERSFLGKR